MKIRKSQWLELLFISIQS